MTGYFSTFPSVAKNHMICNLCDHKSRLVLSKKKITKQINSKLSLLKLIFKKKTGRKYGNLPPSREPCRFLPQSHSKTYSMYLVQARVLLISTSPMITLDTVRYKLGFGNDMYFSWTSMKNSQIRNMKVNRDHLPYMWAVSMNLVVVKDHSSASVYLGVCSNVVELGFCNCQRKVNMSNKGLK